MDGKCTELQGTASHSDVQSPVEAPHILKSSNPIFPWNSYREYIKELCRSCAEYNPLNKFLSKTGATPSETRVLIADSIDGDHFRMEAFGATSQASSPAACLLLATALALRRDDVRTRIVHIMYRRSRHIDRDLLDAVSMHFQLNPRVLWEILDMEPGRADFGNLELPPCSPSEQLGWDLDIIDISMKILFREKTGNQTSESALDEKRV
jgi:hypothetical protein